MQIIISVQTAKVAHNEPVCGRVAMGQLEEYGARGDTGQVQQSGCSILAVYYIITQHFVERHAAGPNSLLYIRSLAGHSPAHAPTRLPTEPSRA